MMFTPFAFSAAARLSGVWPPNCTMTPSQHFSCCVDLQHVLEGERLEIEPVGLVS